MPLIFAVAASKSQPRNENAGTFMYLSICRAIRDRDVDAAVRAGARRPADIFRACGTNPQCGGCASDLRQRISQTISAETACPQLAAAD